jgi:uncharacterized RDD family membrane protein YckC
MSSGSHGEIRLPPGARPYQGRPAGLVSRGIAAVIDGLVTGVLLLLAYGALVVASFALDPRSFQFPHTGLVFGLVTFLCMLVVYLALSWWVSGRTFGAAVMGLRVVGHDGGDLGFPTAAARAVVCALFPIGLLWVAVSPASRSVQDLLLRTSVVYDWRQ